MRRHLKKLTAFTLAALMAFFCFITYQQVDAEGTEANGAELLDTSSNNAGCFNVTGDNGWSYSSNTITINSDGTYTITRNCECDEAVHEGYQIVIGANITVDLTINNVQIHNVSGAAMSIDGTAKVTLRLVGDNRFDSLNEDSGSSNSHAGIEFNNAAANGGSLTITSDAEGSVYARGGWYCAGIGGGSNYSGDNITIAGGIVTAYGQNGGAGIGGGRYGGGTNIKITGGTVTGTMGTSGGAGIGSGQYGSSASITITGGTIDVSGAGGGAGIGSGANSTGNTTITIEGGTVYAEGGSRISRQGGGAGIGSGKSSSGSTNITITGGNIFASGYTGPRSDGGMGGTYDGAGIGAGSSSAGDTTITIEGGTITAIAGRSGGHDIGEGASATGDTTITIKDGSVKATNSTLSVTPTDGNNNNVYLCMIPDISGVNEVTVSDGSATNTYTRNGNHTDGTTEDGTFYLYLVGGSSYDVTANGTKYRALWDKDDYDLFILKRYATSTPTAYFTATGNDSGTLSYVDATMQYSVDGGSTWKPITDTTMSINDVTATDDILVRYAETYDTLASNAQTIDVTQATAPTLSKTDCTTSTQDNGQITGLDSSTVYEYKEENDTDWKTTSGATTIEGLTPGTYYVRVKASETQLASEYVTVTISEHTCAAGDQWQSDEDYHWKNCTSNECSEKLDEESHYGGSATCEEQANCEECGESYGDVLGHSWTGPTWTWSGYSRAIATFTCENDSSHTYTETATITKKTTAPTTTRSGKVVYTATVSSNGTTYTTTKTVILSATGSSSSSNGDTDTDTSSDGITVVIPDTSTGGTTSK